MTRVALVWDERAAGLLRTRYPDAELVSFLWRDRPGDAAVAWGEEGLDYRVTATSYGLASGLAQTWHGYSKGCLLYTSPSPRDS